MVEKRQVPRNQFYNDIKFEVTEVEFNQIRKVMSKGTVIDISEKGLGITTDYPLQMGHVITIKDALIKMPYCVGHVKWIKKEENIYRVGLNSKFFEDISGI